MVKWRVKLIERALGRETRLPLLAVVCCVKGDCRKPGVGMWRAVERLVGPVSLSLSLYVGDAAGRVGDHADSDLAFAQAVGTHFAVPEQLFCPAPKRVKMIDLEEGEGEREREGEVEVEVERGGEGEESATAAAAPPSFPPLLTPPPPFDKWQPLYPDTRPQQELVITLGPPAAGKTSYAKRALFSYIRANRDDLGTFPRVLALVRSALAEGKSVVADNTAGKREQRVRLIKAGRAAGVSVRAVVFHTPLERAKAANKLREGKARVPPVAFASYVKWAEPIDEAVEDYDEICHRERE
jgi:bifunctional polynucleotide phosphatase/kinase